MSPALEAAIGSAMRKRCRKEGHIPRLPSNGVTQAHYLKPKEWLHLIDEPVTYASLAEKSDRHERTVRSALDRLAERGQLRRWKDKAGRTWFARTEEGEAALKAKPKPKFTRRKTGKFCTVTIHELLGTVEMMTAAEICERLQMPYDQVANTITKLRKYGKVERVGTDLPAIYRQSRGTDQ